MSSLVSWATWNPHMMRKCAEILESQGSRTYISQSYIQLFEFCENSIASNGLNRLFSFWALAQPAGKPRGTRCRKRPTEACAGSFTDKVFRDASEVKYAEKAALLLQSLKFAARRHRSMLPSGHFDTYFRPWGLQQCDPKVHSCINIA